MLMPWWDELKFFLFFHLTCSNAPWCSKELFQHKLEAFTDWEGDKLTNWENDSQVHWQTPHVSRPLLSWVKHVCSPGFILSTWDMRNTAHTAGLMWGRDEAGCQCLVSYTGGISDKFLVLIPLFPQPMSTNKKWCSKNIVGPGKWVRTYFDTNNTCPPKKAAHT